MSDGHEEITCAAAHDQLSMLLYGELSFDAEERVESHLDACPECRAALEREKALHAALRTVEIEPSPALLHACRENLHAHIVQEAARPQSQTGWWEQFTGMLAQRPAWMALRPVAALTLLALGFIGGRMIPGPNFAGDGGSFQAAGVAEPASSRVRNVEKAADGRVQIALDETRQRVVSGGLDDANIRALLLSAAKDPLDPALRVETMDILNRSAQAADVRDALIYALRNDQNAGVRLKAMEGLKPFNHEADVRGALSQVLLSDHNPGLRTQAIDLLTSGSGADQEMIGTLQELMERGEEQGYVRERALHVLQSMKASTETY
jgi:putative zinc finger protein/HEAT repeat protein